MKAWKAELVLLLCTLIWSGTFLFTKIGLDYTSPALFMMLRYAVGLMFALIFCGKHLKTINREIIRQGSVLGFFLGGGFILQAYGLEMTTVSKSAFITSSTVLFTPFLYYFIERKRIKLWSILGVIIVSAGLWIFTNPDFANLNFGDVLTLISTVFWGLYVIYIDVYTRGKSDMALTSQLMIIQLVFAIPLTSIFFFSNEISTFYFKWDWNLITALLFNGVGSSFLTTLMHTRVQSYSTPVRATLIFSVEPIIASSFAVIFIAEFFGLREIIGGAILLSGVLIAELGGILSKKYAEY